MAKPTPTPTKNPHFLIAMVSIVAIVALVVVLTLVLNSEPRMVHLLIVLVAVLVGAPTAFALKHLNKDDYDCDLSNEAE